MLNFFKRQVQPHVERLDLYSTLPYAFAFKLDNGIKYVTGADYTEEQLKTPVIELYEVCKACYNGAGLVYSQNGEDDYNSDVCDVCWGTGKVFKDINNKEVF